MCLSICWLPSDQPQTSVHLSMWQNGVLRIILHLSVCLSDSSYLPTPSMHLKVETIETAATVQSTSFEIAGADEQNLNQKSS